MSVMRGNTGCYEHNTDVEAPWNTIAFCDNVVCSTAMWGYWPRTRSSHCDTV